MHILIQIVLKSRKKMAVLYVHNNKIIWSVWHIVIDCPNL